MEDSRFSPVSPPSHSPRIAEGELRFLGQVGAALWSEADRGASELEEAIELAAVTTRIREGQGEFAARTLLDRARAAGTLAFRGVVADPFWRLPLELRFLLAASHGSYRASYARLRRILSARAAALGEDGFNEPTEEGDTSVLQQLLWSARTQFAAAVGLPIPAGAPARSPSCPEYRSRAPWTQRFLDDELSVRERLFLQNHLMSCDDCRGSLESCRKLLAAIEVQLARRGVLAPGEGALAPHQGKAEVPGLQEFARSAFVFWAMSFLGVAALLILLWSRG